MQLPRVVITGVGLTAPNGNTLPEFRENLLRGVAHIENIDVRYMGTVHAGICSYDARKYQSRRELRNSTRAGSIAIFCAHEALADAAMPLDTLARDRVGVIVGITEHGNVETENEIYNISQFDYDTRYWTHHHNPRTVANNPAGEVTMNLQITGPHYTVGAACAAGNAGVISALQQLQLGEIDFALAGGVSESVQAFGIFAGFKSQGALAVHEDPNRASRPFDMGRNGIVVAEGGCLFTLERLDDAVARGARIYGEIVGYAINSDAHDAVLPYAPRQAECMRKALNRANLDPADVDIVNMHATATPQGDIQECESVRAVFGEAGDQGPYINGTKSYIGHAMGAAGALELAGNLPALTDGWIHPTINVDELDPACELPKLVVNQAVQTPKVEVILNNSFGMLGINSTLIVSKCTP